MAYRHMSLEYENEAGNAHIGRVYHNHGDFVTEIDTERMYNYVTEAWETTSRFVRDYALADDGETLKGDGSSWRGTGRKWDEYFEERHYDRLEIRFPHDTIVRPRQKQ